jgi:protoporphyrinogen oxidase
VKKLVLRGGITGLTGAWEASHSGPYIGITCGECQVQLGAVIRAGPTDGLLLEKGQDSLLAPPSQGLGGSHSVAPIRRPWRCTAAAFFLFSDCNGETDRCT